MFAAEGLQKSCLVKKTGENGIFFPQPSIELQADSFSRKICTGCSKGRAGFESFRSEAKSLQGNPETAEAQSSERILAKLFFGRAVPAENPVMKISKGFRGTPNFSPVIHGEAVDGEVPAREIFLQR